ncbi:MAG: histidine phosphatase family protein [Marmoricola sp.]
MIATRRVHLVRHGAPLVDRDAAAATWSLDPAATDDVRRLAADLPRRARWFTSPEPRARQTAELLTDADVEVVGDLAEQVRLHAEWIDDFDAVRRAALREPDVSAHEGWEPAARTRRRLRRALGRILAEHPDEDIVVISHGTAIALMAADLTDSPVDIDLPGRLALPDVVVVELRRPQRVPPPSPAQAAIGTLLVAAAELFSHAAGDRLGIVSAVVALLGLLLAVVPRTRSLGWSVVAGAAVGLLVAAILVVAGAPRMGG